ncbi:MAG: hypothetical protein AB4058_00665 [Microcystaceae cyanobacterium]
MTKTQQNQVQSPYSMEDIKQQIQSKLSTLSPNNLQAILEVTNYLSGKESEEATQEIREIPNIMQLLEIAETQVKNGELIDWEEPRILGIDRDKLTIPDDFDAPLSYDVNLI